jgi:hypothetical protein
MATSVKKERSRRTSWLSPMWRDIDSLRKQNESTKKEIESMRRKSKQTEIETEILRRQNKALALIESSDLDALLKEANVPGSNHSKHTEDQLDLELLEKKLVALGCDVNDIPFLFDVLELRNDKELRPLIAIPKVTALSKNNELSDNTREVRVVVVDDSGFAVIQDAYFKGFLLNPEVLAERAIVSHVTAKRLIYCRNNAGRILYLCCSGPEHFNYERIVFPYEEIVFQCLPKSEVKIWAHEYRGKKLLDRFMVEDLPNEEPNASVGRVSFSEIESG